MRLEPEAIPARIESCERRRATEDPGQLLVLRDEAAGQDKPKPIPARQEVAGEQILLRVVAKAPLRRIVVGQPDVVQADEYAGGESREDLEEEDGDVRVLKRPVGVST